MLPHGQRSAPATEEHWTDPDTRLVHHRVPFLSDAQFQMLVDVTRHASTAVAYSLEVVACYAGDT